VKIAMHIKISGGRGDLTEWPDPHVPFEVDDAEGAQLCAGGLAYPVAEDAPVETRGAFDDGGDLPAGTSLAFNAGKPIVNSPKAAWVEHAVAQGFDRAEAEAMKKSDLINVLKEG
jgi:hypothetical protein